MHLEPLYELTFRYPDAWSVSVAGGDTLESNHFFFAEGRCRGRVTGSMRGANHPVRRGDGTFCPDFDGVIETHDGAHVLFHLGGYGRSYPEEGRQIVCWLTHLSDDARYRWLNDVVCVGTGTVGTEALVIEIAELVWEPPGAGVVER